MSREYIQFGNDQIGYKEGDKLYILWFQPWNRVVERWNLPENNVQPLTLSSILTNTRILASIRANKDYASYMKEALEQMAKV